jgi:hypothetical protein
MDIDFRVSIVLSAQVWTLRRAVLKKRGFSLIVGLLVLSSVGCRPCGCTEADLSAATIALINQIGGLGANVNGAQLQFDWSPGFGDDRFTMTLSWTDAAGPHTEPFTGTYHTSGDTVTFKFDPKPLTQALIRGGTQYTVTCGKDEKGRKLLKLRAPGMTTDLVFTCSG